ncbi:MAG: hypothetical protein KF795_25545 [Labilithrix sp.]|nr:hypothetical protein [Labilithrix sp.]
MHRAAALLAFLPALVTMPLVAACGDENPPASTGASSSGAPAPTTSPTGTSPPDGGGANTPLCASEPRTAGTAIEIRMAGTQPAPLGGTIAPGTYALSEVYTWTAPIADAGEDIPTQQVTGKIASKTLRLTATDAKLIGAEGTESGGLGADRLTAGTYTTEGVSFVLRPTCAAGPVKTYGYTASSAGIVLYDGDRQEIFSVVP